MDVTSLKKSNSGEIAIGFDLTDTYSQVSYALMDEDHVETFSTVPGTFSYRIPTALLKRREVNQWFAGKDAVKNKDFDGYYIDKLVSLAKKETVKIGDEDFKPSALIALFMKRTLSLVSFSFPANKIVSFMVTVENLDENMVRVLSEAVASLNLKTNNIFFQSHTESFYYYNIYQPGDLWKREVLLLDFSGETLLSLRMECNRNTTPIVAFIAEERFRNFYNANIEGLSADTSDAYEADERLHEIVEKLTEGRLFSAIYFIGDAFNQEVFKESVRLVCSKGRVFEGNNLYSKGAAFAAKNKVAASTLSLGHVFLGNEKLKSNIGINVIKRGQNAYMALLDGGINWFEAHKECDIILDKGNKVSLVITPLTGKNPEVVDITLEDLPKRPPKTTRLNLRLNMTSVNSLEVTITDLGFGELFKGSMTEWKEVIGV